MRRAQRRPAWNRYRGDCTPPQTVHGPKSGNVMAGCRPGRGGGRESVGGRSLVGRVLRCAITPAPHARAVRTVRGQGPGLVDRPGAFCALRRRRGAEDRRQLSAEHGTTHLAESAAFSGQDDPHITVYKRHWAVPGPLHAGCAPGMQPHGEAKDARTGRSARGGRPIRRECRPRRVGTERNDRAAVQGVRSPSL